MIYASEPILHRDGGPRRERVSRVPVLCFPDINSQRRREEDETEREGREKERDYNFRLPPCIKLIEKAVLREDLRGSKRIRTNKRDQKGIFLNE